jgi:uncharacterized membrane protein YdjX (TVP38/TMEM64 family)
MADNVPRLGRKRGKPFLSRDNVNGAPSVMPFLKVTLSFLGGRLLLGSSGLCFGGVLGESASSFCFFVKGKKGENGEKKSRQ